MVFTVRSQILPITFIIHRKMYPIADSSNHLTDIPPDNCDLDAKNGTVVGALLRNDDAITLRSIIRRTRGVCLVSKGTLYERANDALEEAINGVRSRTCSALSGYVTLLDLRRTLPGEHQLFAGDALTLIVS